MLSRVVLKNNIFMLSARLFSEGAGQSTGPQTSTPNQVNANVPGLSSAVVHPASQPVGPGVDPNKSGAYKVPEYFCYDNTSFFEAEVEMAKYRLQQPSALKK